jgi:serine/threonine-protein phosphatase 6 regulatory ankyrin repeat subunit B
LILASQNGHKEIVKTLLAKGADVNAKMNDGATALILASKKGYKEIKELLVGAGAK